MEEKEYSTKNERPSKLYTIMITLVIVILIIGFIFMSLILFNILKIVDGFSRDFINFVSNFLEDFGIKNLLTFWM